MELNGHISEELCRTVEEETNRAIEVFNFIMKLPSPWAEFVFKRIVDDSYAIASVLSKQKAKEYLILSICNTLQATQNIDPICSYLGVISHYKEVDKLVTDTDALRLKLIEVCNFEQIPNREGLILSYSCFSIPYAGDDYVENMWEMIRLKLMGILSKDRNDSAKEDCLKEYCFLKLGYKTLLEKWVCNCIPSSYDSILVKWYCDGELIDIILDTIFKCEVTSVSQGLWNHLVYNCEQNPYLSQIVQQRYDRYQRFFPALGKYVFEYKGDKKMEYKGMVASLPCIPTSYTNKTPIDDHKLYDLYEMLCMRGELSCEFQSFKSAFSGETKTTQPIMWLKGQKELASFLYVLRANRCCDMSYAKKAELVFVQRNGKPCRAVTLNQPDYDVCNDYKKLFNEVVISR